DAAGRSLDDICFDLVRESLGDDEFLIEGDRIVWMFSFHITEDLMSGCSASI
ncbi:MAG TPA: hypothetical protein HA285_03270, partial [Methanothermobacter thermautotrophicus]|nr:hypothetical protein [Methanothermobacter thermautotrophicus]